MVPGEPLHLEVVDRRDFPVGDDGDDFDVAVRTGQQIAWQQ
jgi:hypothetical protein